MKQMRIMFEDVLTVNNKNVWVHADFKVRAGEVEVVEARVYDLNPQGESDVVDVTPEIINTIAEAIEDELELN